MVRSLFVSSLLALSAVVSAGTPLVRRSLANIEADTIGAKNIDVTDNLNNALNIDSLLVGDNLNGARVLSDGNSVHEYDYNGGDFGGIGNYDVGDSGFDREPFEYVDGGDHDIDGDFDDYFGDGNDGGNCGGDCGSGCGGGRGRHHPRIPHRVGRTRGGCR